MEYRHLKRTGIIRGEWRSVFSMWQELVSGKWVDLTASTLLTLLYNDTHWLWKIEKTFQPSSGSSVRTACPLLIATTTWWAIWLPAWEGNCEQPQTITSQLSSHLRVFISLKLCVCHCLRCVIENTQSSVLCENKTTSVASNVFFFLILCYSTSLSIIQHWIIYVFSNAEQG